MLQPRFEPVLSSRALLVLACLTGCASGTAVQQRPAAALLAPETTPADAAAAPAADPASPSVASASGDVAAAQRLEFAEFFEPGAGLRPSQKLRSLAGQRVRLVGFMAQLELPPTGAFYLVPRPVRCDESGAGNADLPPESVLVLSASSAGRVVPFLTGALELSGTLELGNQPDSEGRMVSFRLRLDAS